MIDYICGPLAEKGTGWVVIEANGIGYRIEVPVNIAVDKDPADGHTRLYTRMVIREDRVTLFGFTNSEQRNLFSLITGVSGIGPRIALSVLGMMSVSDFYISVLEENIKGLCRIPGVGKKTAQRLILELKEKLPSGTINVNDNIQIPAGGVVGSNIDEALNALCALGYSNEEAVAVMNGVRPDIGPEASTEEILKIALKKIAASKEKSSGGGRNA